MSEQLLNKIVNGLAPQGILEKIMCGGNQELHYSENNIGWDVQAIEADGAIKSHTSGSAVAANTRGSAFHLALTTPYYITKRAISVDDIVSRAGATGGFSAEGAVEKVLGNDVKFLSRDLKFSVEKQVSILIKDTDVEYVDDGNTTRNFPTYDTSGSNPTSAGTLSVDLSDDVMGALDEMVAKCTARGFLPDACIVGSAAAALIMADSDIQALIKANAQQPGLFELRPEDGGSYLGRINTPSGASLAVYTCYEAESGTPLVTPKGMAMIQSGCCQTLVGVVPVPQAEMGKWSMEHGRIVAGFKQGEIDQMLVVSSRAVVVPVCHAWEYCADAVGSAS